LQSLKHNLAKGEAAFAWVLPERIDPYLLIRSAVAVAQPSFSNVLLSSKYYIAAFHVG